MIVHRAVVNTPSTGSSSSRSTTFGWVLWRGGLWFCGLYIGWEATIRTWRFLLSLQLPGPVLIGIVMMLIGLILVMASLILERMKDAKMEGDLLHEQV